MELLKNAQIVVIKLKNRCRKECIIARFVILLCAATITQQSTSGIVGRTTCIIKLSLCLGLPRVSEKPTLTPSGECVEYVTKD